MTGFAETPDNDLSKWIEIDSPEALAAHTAEIREKFYQDAAEKIRELILETGMPANMQSLAEDKVMRHFDAIQAGGAAMLERMLSGSVNH